MPFRPPSSTLFPYPTLFRSFAKQSYTRAAKARDSGIFAKEIVPVVIASRKGKPEITVREDRKSTRLNSSHVASSYAVFCLKKKTERPTWLRTIQYVT